MVAFAFRFLEVRAFCTVISLLKPFPVNLYLKNSCEGMELLRLNPLRFRFSVKKKGWRWLLSHFSSSKVVLSAQISRCRSRFPFYLLSESFLTDWSCIGLTRCGSCFSLRKEWLELVACAFRFLESCTFQRCFLVAETHFRLIFYLKNSCEE